MAKTPADQRKRAAIYTRISEDKTGEKAGVDRQLEDCTKLAASLGWQVVDTFDDNDISAYSGKRRPRFEDLLEAMQTGQVDAVLCWHTDRLYRSMKDLERFIEIAEAAHISIKSVQAGELDLATSAGRMVARILGSVARQESEHHSERRVRACVQKAGTGVWETANRPFGYGARVKCRDDGCGCEDYHEVGVPGQPYEPEAQAIRDAVADVLEGTSIQAIARRWNEAGLTTTAAGRTYRHGEREYTAAGTWRAPRVRRVLLNPRYAGLKVHHGKVAHRDGKPVEGGWEALIDVATHERLVAYLTDPTRTTTVSWERKLPGSGIYRCGVCGGPMKSDVAGGKDRPRRHRYVCRLSGGHVLRNAENLDAFVANAILDRLSDANLVVSSKRRGDDVSALQDERAEWVSKLDTLVDLLDDGTLDGPKARQRAAEYKERIAAIDRRLRAALRISPAARLRASGGDLRERWEAMDATLRSQVIDELAVVTVLPARRGRGFDTEAVEIRWKQ
jgi:DNA invertase Pin-like site-specific DNA recombinase